MMTSGFGRSVTAPPRPGLVLLPDAAAEFSAPVIDLASLSELKERIRTVLLSRIDPAVAGRIPRPTLRREIGHAMGIANTPDLSLSGAELN